MLTVVFELHNAKKCCLGPKFAPQTPIPLYPTGQQKCVWIPRIVLFEMLLDTHRPAEVFLMMGVFELHNAKKYCLASGVAPQTPIPLYPTGQQRCSWIPMMVVFEMHDAEQYWLGSGVAPLCTH